MNGEVSNRFVGCELCAKFSVLEVETLSERNKWDEIFPVDNGRIVVSYLGKQYLRQTTWVIPTGGLNDLIRENSQRVIPRLQSPIMSSYAEYEVVVQHYKPHFRNNGRNPDLCSEWAKAICDARSHDGKKEILDYEFACPNDAKDFYGSILSEPMMTVIGFL